MTARALGAVLLLAGGLAAQEPRFEVVSVRPKPPNAPQTMRTPDFTPVLPGGQYVDSSTIVWSMIAFAYPVNDAWNRIVGLPGWAKERAYSVAAKAGEGYHAASPAENVEQVRRMMRAMLAERFHLQVHREARQETVYRVEVAKGGLKIQETDPPVPPEKEGIVGLAMGDSGGRLIGKKSSIAGLIRSLQVHMKSSMVDATGLAGYYDFDIKWTAPEVPDGHTPAAGFGPDGMALLVSVLQERFGLRLVKATGPVEYLVVDHIEPPTEN